MTAPTDLHGGPYAELPTPRQMRMDCQAVGDNLRLPLEKAARAALSTPPSIHFADFPREVPKRDLQISDAAVRLANSLHLHLD